MSTLSVRNLRVTRGTAVVVEGLNFALRPNRITALLGRNGVGKTSTLLAIMGLLPAGGEVSLDGTRLDRQPTYLRVQQGIAYVPEDREIFPRLTVQENLELAAANREMHRRIAFVYQSFPVLASKRSHLAGTLSGGQQQMLAIGRALLFDAKLNLIDEPTKGLAPIVVAEVMEILAEAFKDKTVLLVEQNLSVAATLTKDALVLSDGKLIWSGSTAELSGDAEKANDLLGVSRSVA